MQATLPRPQNMRAFMVIWFGELISIIGSGLTSFALGVWIYEQTGQATPFALTVLFGSLPPILLAPIAGPVSDRWNRKLVMILADTGAALVTLCTVVLLATHSLTILGIYAIAFCGSVFSAFQEPAYQASVTMLVPKKDLARASGLAQTGQALQMLVSPSLAGILYLSIGLQGVILIDFLTYFFAVAALILTRIPQPPPEETEKKTHVRLGQDAWFGWQYLRARRGLLGMLVYHALTNFFLNLSAVLFSPLVLSFASAATLGVVETVSGVGMLAGSIVLSAWGGPKQRVRGMVTFIMAASVGLLMMGVRANPYLIAAGFFILMFNIPLSSGTSQAIFQSKVAPGIQGRVFAMRGMVARSMMPLAFLMAGPLADRIFEPAMRSNGWLALSPIGNWVGIGAGRGIGVIFVLSGMILLLVSLAAYTYAPLRNLERDLPDVLTESQPEQTPPSPVRIETVAS